MLRLSFEGLPMNQEAVLIELAAAIARLSDSVEATARVLSSLCERLAQAEEETPAEPPRPLRAAPGVLRLIEGTRPGVVAAAVPPPD
jgi:uncharacterized coiled-coil protein SlyX